MTTIMAAMTAAISFAAWVYLIGFRGMFWRSGPEPGSGAPSGKARVAVVVPARNEAEHIGQSLGSLLAQDYSGELTIILVDDGSSDGTSEIATSLAAEERLAIIRGKPLPAGWSGKLWATNQGLAHERAGAADYILLTDADIAHETDHVSVLVAKAEADGRDMVSEMVRLRCVTLAERALIPAFVFFFQMLYPFAEVADPAKRAAGAAGGTMLVSRGALDRIRGVSRIRGELIDDCALAKEIKRTGGRIWLGHTTRADSRRAYSHWKDVWNMIARTAYVQLGNSPLMLLGCVAGMGIVFCAPPVLAIFAHGVSRWLSVLSWLAMAGAIQPTLGRYHRSPLWGLALPGISFFYLCATVASAVRHSRGRGGEWKSRVYRQGSFK